ncbi:alpha/beta fold hydrolase [Nonomuraea sp. NPDC003727]
MGQLAPGGNGSFLLHGRQDMTFPSSLVAATPCAEAVVLAEAGHMAHIDQPEAWLAAVRRFLTA